MRWRAVSIATMLAVGMALGSDAQTTTTYDYDALGRLKSAISSSGISTEYTYDAAGNRTSVESAGGGPPPSESCGVVVVPLAGFTVIPLGSCN